MDKIQYKRLLRSILSTDDYISAVNNLDALINSVKEECANIAERIEPRFANVTAIDINAYAKEHGKFIAKAIRDKEDEMDDFSTHIDRFQVKEDE